MNKQEFLAMSIFSNLKYLDDNNKIVELHCVDNGIGLVNFGWGDAKEFTNVKPILHPLSSLIKEIEHKMEKFVPLYKLFQPPIDKEDCAFTNERKSYRLWASIGSDVFKYDVNKDCDINNLWVTLKLIEWHFDLAGLIEKNEAIDVNTLKENPYK